MVRLPSFIFCLLIKTCLSAGAEAPAESELSVPKCPGKCVDETSCFSTVNDTDCSGQLVCCLDLLETTEAEELAELELAAENEADNEIAGQIQIENAEELDSQAYETYVEPEAPDGYTYVYSEEASVSEEKIQGTCPGACVQAHEISGCDYVASSGMCHESLSCCLSEEDVKNMDQSYQIDDEPYFVDKSESEQYAVSDCPGTCVHPSNAMSCDILEDFTCPLNTLCCKKKPVGRSLSGANVFKCSGQCLPPQMQGYCFPPNELILGTSNCPRGTACCARRPSENMMAPPTVTRMQHPGLAPKHNFKENQQVLGQLAVDDAGTVFRVSNDGQVSALPRITHIDHARAKFTKQMAYPYLDGEIVIYSDVAGTLYQQFYPRIGKPQMQANPTIRRPVYEFDPQSTQHKEQYSVAQELQADDTLASPAETEAMEDVVIPDDDEGASIPLTNAPALKDDQKTSRPACPGSCMSYFLRFTCFRGYAIYDGFTCSGRSVCCARLGDIEDHEKYLKSLSPYFNAPPASRDSTSHRCGIKGTRDTPRVMGGSDAIPGEWCWQVAVINIQNQYICGGALIDNSWVLTAAHCVAGPMRENQALFVRVGVTDLKSPEDNRKGQTVRVLSTFVHHNYNGVNLDNNIALLRLKKPVELSANVCVVCLPTTGEMPKDDTRCTVTGYGFVSPDGDMSLRIREAQVPIVDDMECMSNVTEALTNPFIIPSSSFCAGGHGQSDVCQGDAGGPLACEVGGFYEIAGLVSWGLGCGKDDVPSIYVKVPSFMGWINQIISSSSFLLSLN